MAVVRRALDDGEAVTHRGVCWAVVRRSRVPLLILGRHQYDVVLTDRRLMLFARRRRRLRADDVAFAKRFASLTLEATPPRPLLQQRIRTDIGAVLILEWRPHYRHVGHALEAELAKPATRRSVATA